MYYLAATICPFLRYCQFFRADFVRFPSYFDSTLCCNALLCSPHCPRLWKAEHNECVTVLTQHQECRNASTYSCRLLSVWCNSVTCTWILNWSYLKQDLTEIERNLLWKIGNIFKSGKLWQPNLHDSTALCLGFMVLCDLGRECVGIKMYALLNDGNWF